MAFEWHPVPGTDHWELVDDESNMIIRQIAVRNPYFNESKGTKYVVTGNRHIPSTHASFAEARAAAEASL